MSRPVDFSRVFEIISYQQEKYAQRAALNYFENEKWTGLSTTEIQQRVDSISGWLIAQGFQKGDCVAIVPRMGSPRWMMIDFACQQLGMITVPLHPTSSADEMKFILDETKSKLCLAADVALYEKVKSVFTNSNIFHLNDKTDGYFSALNF